MERYTEEAFTDNSEIAGQVSVGVTGATVMHQGEQEGP